MITGSGDSSCLMNAGDCCGIAGGGIGDEIFNLGLLALLWKVNMPPGLGRFGSVVVVLPRRRGFMAGIGGDGLAILRLLFGGRPTSGTEDVLEIRVGSEIMPLVTDFFRLPAPGVVRPELAGGVCRPDRGGCGDGKDVLRLGDDIETGGCHVPIAECIPGFGEGLGASKAGISGESIIGLLSSEGDICGRLRLRSLPLDPLIMAS